MHGKEITIGTLSAHTDVKVETIRYYEKIGLMPTPPRKDGGHRIYGEDHQARLRFIRRGRELGFPLDDIRRMLGIEDNEPNCAQVYEIAQAHLQDVRAKMKDLKRLEKKLTEVSKRCERGDSTDCAIIQALSG